MDIDLGSAHTDIDLGSSYPQDMKEFFSQEIPRCFCQNQYGGNFSCEGILSGLPLAC